MSIAAFVDKFTHVNFQIDLYAVSPPLTFQKLSPPQACVAQQL